MEHSVPQVVPLSTSEAARMLGVGRATIHRYMDDGTLVPIRKMSGRLGGYLFKSTDIEVLAAARVKELEAQLAAIRAGGAA